MKKYIFGAVLSIGLLVSPAFTQAAGLTTVQINAILSLLSSFGADQSVINNVQASLTGSAPTTGGQSFCHNFNSDLTVGNSGDDVVALNQALSLSGIDTTGNTSSFNENNAGDVVAFQSHYGIRQTGYVGPMTRAKLNALYGCKASAQPVATNPTSSGVCAIQSFVATPSTVTDPVVSHPKTTLSWATTNCTAVYITATYGPTFTQLATSGSMSTDLNPSVTTTYTLRASTIYNPYGNNSGEVTRDLTVSVVASASYPIVPLISGVSGTFTPGINQTVSGQYLSSVTSVTLISTTDGKTHGLEWSPRSDSLIGIDMPDNPAIPAGLYYLYLTNSAGTSKGFVIGVITDTIWAPHISSITVGPHIYSMVPLSARAGDTITIYGSKFDGDSWISIGGGPGAVGTRPVYVNSYTAYSPSTPLPYASLTFTIPQDMNEGEFSVFVVNRQATGDIPSDNHAVLTVVR